MDFHFQYDGNIIADTDSNPISARSDDTYFYLFYFFAVWTVGKAALLKQRITVSNSHMGFLVEHNGLLFIGASKSEILDEALHNLIFA